MWLYKGKVIKEIKDLPKNTFGFVYQTIHTPTGLKYIGKKSLIYNQKKKLTKKELAEYIGPGRKPKTRKTQKESDWKTYYGSHTKIKGLLKEGKQDEFNREILEIAYHKKELTYLECKWQFKCEVLELDEYLNYNILGKFFDKDFV
jgi:RecB family exonuclease